MRISDWSSDVCSSDLDQLLASLPENAAAEWLSIAYEPVWAIGTGRTPTLDAVAAMHAALRDALRSRIGGEAHAMRMLYGGSMNGANAASLLAVAGVHGGLVCGASLTADTLAPICQAAELGRANGLTPVPNA